MPDVSLRQAEYIRRHRRHHHLVALCRFLAFAGFLILWEISVNLEWIDAFIFSSPSRVLQTILEMGGDHTLFRHTGITLYETLLSFALVILVSFLAATLLWFSLRDPGALAGHTEQSAQISSGPAPDRMAGRQHEDDHHRRYVRGSIWQYHQHVYSVSHYR